MSQILSLDYLGVVADVQAYEAVSNAPFRAYEAPSQPWLVARPFPQLFGYIKYTDSMRKHFAHKVGHNFYC